MGIYEKDIQMANDGEYLILLTKENYEKIKQFSNVISIENTFRANQVKQILMFFLIVQNFIGTWIIMAHYIFLKREQRLNCNP